MARLLRALEPPRRPAVRAAALTAVLRLDTAALADSGEAAHRRALAGGCGTGRECSPTWHRCPGGGHRRGRADRAGARRRPDGERRLTDLRHLGRRCTRQRSTGRLGLAGARSTGCSGASTRRPTSGPRRAPGGWSPTPMRCRSSRSTAPRAWSSRSSTCRSAGTGHVPETTTSLGSRRRAPVLDVAARTGPGPASAAQADRAEELGESLRLLYVALTRAVPGRRALGPGNEHRTAPLHRTCSATRPGRRIRDPSRLSEWRARPTGRPVRGSAHRRARARAGDARVGRWHPGRGHRRCWRPRRRPRGRRPPGGAPPTRAHRGSARRRGARPGVGTAPERPTTAARARDPAWRLRPRPTLERSAPPSPLADLPSGAAFGPSSTGCWSTSTRPRTTSPPNSRDRCTEAVARRFHAGRPRGTRRGACFRRSQPRSDRLPTVVAGRSRSPTGWPSWTSSCRWPAATSHAPTTRPSRPSPTCCAAICPLGPDGAATPTRCQPSPAWPAVTWLPYRQSRRGSARPSPDGGARDLVVDYKTNWLGGSAHPAPSR